MQEIKCPSCFQWTDRRNTICPHCSSSLDRHQVLREERVRQGTLTEPKAPKKSRVELWLEQTEQSDNGGVRLLRTLLKMAWAVYMGLIAFVVWFVTLFSG